MKKIQLLTIVVFTIIASSQANDTIRIMPVGNSITAGEHYGFPTLKERTGYRKTLYEILKSASYNVDFVGSQKHGIKPKDSMDWYDWNCEAYPGWEIPEITNKLDTALLIYHPDILLVHVGTNGENWDEKPVQVKNMLDRIDKYSVNHEKPITVFLCLIINRFLDEDAAPTSKFNKEVTEMVNKRTGDKIQIVIVDMENGAGLDYSDKLPNPNTTPPYEGGDMLGKKYPGVAYDKYHPNDKGNTKMAVKFYNELVKILPLPAKSEKKVYKINS